MAEEKQKRAKYQSVRIWADEKDELLELVLEKTRLKKKRVTEVEETSAAVKAYVRREKRKLGIA